MRCKDLWILIWMFEEVSRVLVGFGVRRMVIIKLIKN